MTTTENGEVLALLDRLDNEQRNTAVRFIESLLIDPVALALANAPLDDEPVTEEDRRRFHEGRAFFADGGRGASMEEVLADFGLTLDDFPLSQ